MSQRSRGPTKTTKAPDTVQHLVPSESATTALSELVKGMTETIAQLSSREAHIRTLVEALVERNADLKAEGTLLSAQVKVCESDCAALSERVALLKSEVQNLESRRIVEEQHVLTLEQRRLVLETEVATLAEERSKVQAENSRLAGVSQELLQEVDILKRSGRPGSPWVQPDLPQWLNETDKFSCRIPVIDRLAIEIILHDDYRHLFPPTLGTTRDSIILAALRNHLPWGEGTVDAYELALKEAHRMEARRAQVVPGSRNSSISEPGRKHREPGRPSKYSALLPSSRRELAGDQ